MILAHMAAQYPEELTCDMAETYHVLDWRALGLPLAATLAAGLRENSRTRMALAGAKVPTETLLLGAATAAVDENQGRPAWPEPPRAPCAHPVGAGAGV